MEGQYPTEESIMDEEKEELEKCSNCGSICEPHPCDCRIYEGEEE